MSLLSHLFISLTVLNGSISTEEYREPQILSVQSNDVSKDQDIYKEEILNLYENAPIPSAYPSTIWFGEENSTALHLVGGKGASLSVLQSVPGIHVPKGFIITTEVYKEFVSSNSALQNKLLKLDTLSDAWIAAMLKSEGQTTEEIRDLEANISEESHFVNELILGSSISLSISNQLIREYQALSKYLGKENLAVAVRSSATAEDLPNASFAGQHDTFLNQKGDQQIIDSVVRCWTSLFHPHTVQYRNQLRLGLFLQNKENELDPTFQQLGNNLKHSEVKLAVVVQQIIQPAAAGVGFNVSPTGESKIHIEANYGLGETVVGGLVNPDSWEIDEEGSEILFSKLGDKTIKAMSKESGGVEFLPLPQLDQQRFVMKNEQVLEVAQAIRNIGMFYQDLFGYKYIDTEFVIDEFGELYFVQARPETVFSSEATMTVMGIQDAADKALVLHRGGASGYPGAYTGRLVYATTPQEALEKIKPGDILVTNKTTPDWSIVFPKLGGIIVNIGGVLSHTAIVGREHRIPTILSAVDATKTLADKDGKTVTMDATNSVVYDGTLKLIEGPIQDFIESNLQNNAVPDLEIQIHRVDEDGKWMSRPHVPLSALQLNFLQDSYDRISDLLELDSPIEHKVVDKMIFVKVEELNGDRAAYTKITDLLYKWDLNRLEALFDHRVESVRQLIDFAENFEAAPNQLKEFHKFYQDWTTHFLIRGRFGHGAVAMLMQEHLNKIPDPSILSAYMALRYPVINKSNEKQQEHQRLVKTLSELGVKKQADLELTKEWLTQNHPDVWQKIIHFASLYEHIASEDFRTPIPIDTVIKQLLITLDDQELNFEPAKLSMKQIVQMDTLFAKNKELARIMILAHQHLFQKENEHHWIAHAQHQIHAAMLKFGQKLVQEGKLMTASEVFDHDIDQLIQMSQLNPKETQ